MRCLFGLDWTIWLSQMVGDEKNRAGTKQSRPIDDFTQISVVSVKAHARVPLVARPTIAVIEPKLNKNHIRSVELQVIPDAFQSLTGRVAVDPTVANYDVARARFQVQFGAQPRYPWCGETN